MNQTESVFFEDDFSETNYIASILSDPTLFQGALQTLKSGVNRLDDELKDQVVIHRETLLEQVGILNGLKADLNVLEKNLDSLSSHLDNVKKLDLQPISQLQKVFIFLIFFFFFLLHLIINFFYFFKKKGSKTYSRLSKFM